MRVLVEIRNAVFGFPMPVAGTQFATQCEARLQKIPDCELEELPGSRPENRLALRLAWARDLSTTISREATIVLFAMPFDHEIAFGFSISDTGIICQAHPPAQLYKTTSRTTYRQFLLAGKTKTVSTPAEPPWGLRSLRKARNGWQISLTAQPKG